jgi:hypothetical protein
MTWMIAPDECKMMEPSKNGSILGLKANNMASFGANPGASVDHSIQVASFKSPKNGTAHPRIASMEGSETNLFPSVCGI